MYKPERVVIVGATYPELELYCPNFNGMKAGLERLGIPYLFVTCRPTLDVQQIKDYNPDLVVYALRDAILHPMWRKDLKAALPSTKFVVWYGDYRDNKTGQYQADISELDCLFISNDAQETFYKHKWNAKHVSFLPLGAEPIPEPLYNKKFDMPFIFIGGQISGPHFHDRAMDIQSYIKDDGLKLINSFEPDMRKTIMKAVPEIYSSAKIALDISHFTNVQGYTSNRFWVIPANFGFALTKRWPGCTDFYPEDTRAYFDTHEEAIRLRDYYLKHDDERIAMIQRAHKHSYNHSYDKRFLQMFKVLEGLCNNK